MRRLVVAAQFVDEEPVDVAVDVNGAAIDLVVRCRHIAFRTVIFILYRQENFLIHIVFIRFLHHHRKVEPSGVEFPGLVIIGVEFENISAFGDGNPFLRGLYLLTEIICAAHLPVEPKFHKLSFRSPVQTIRASGNLKRDIVTQQRAVHPLGKQAPAFVFPHSD